MAGARHRSEAQHPPLDALIAAIRSELGQEAVIEPEAIPVTDVAVPVVGRSPVARERDLTL